MAVKQAVRGAVRTLLWPVRRFFDPRFDGVLERVDEVRWLVRADMDAANEATAVIGRSLADTSQSVADLREAVQEVSRRVEEHAREPAAGAPLTDRLQLEAVSRRATRSVTLGDDTLLCRVLGRYMMYADASDYTVAPHLCLDGYWESWITVAIARSLQPGWHCVDVGANHGYYTVMMADAVGPTGRVLAIEPQPSPARLLKKTLRVNGLDDRTTVVEKAASDAVAARASLVIPAGRGADASLFGEPGTDDEIVEVETVTLDELTREWARVDLVKLDIEGSEEAAWSGMREMVKGNPDVVVVMEVKASRYESAFAFLGEIVRDGFPLRHIDIDSSVKPISIDEIVNKSPDESFMLFLHRT